jgi:hypothetical protein
MSLFRTTVIILALAGIAAAVVHLRWSNAHLAYKIQQANDHQRDLARKYQENRFELARWQSPQHLREKIELWSLPLEGWMNTTQPSQRSSTPRPSGGPARDH